MFRVGCADGAVVSLHNHFGEVHADAGAFVEVVVGGLIITFKHLVEFTGGYAAARIFYFYDYKLRLLLVFLFDCDIDETAVGCEFECVGQDVEHHLVEVEGVEGKHNVGTVGAEVEVDIAGERQLVE